MPFLGSKQKKGNLPLVTAYEDEANIFTQVQKVKVSSGSLLTLYRNGVDANGSTAGIDISLDNLAHFEKVYTQYLGAIEDSTTTAEKGQAIIKILHTGALRQAFKINNDGTIDWGTPTGPLGRFSAAGLTTTIKTFTFPNQDTLMAGQNFINVFSVAQKFDAGGVKLKPIGVPTTDAAYGIVYADLNDSNKLKYKYPNGTVLDLSVGAGGGGSGETNTASNIGTAGVGIFKQKVGVNFELKKINTSTATYLTITDDTSNNEVDVAVTALVAKTDFTNIFSVVQKFDVGGIKIKPVAVPTTDAAYGIFYSDSADANKPKYKYPNGTVLDLSLVGGGGGGETNTMSNIGTSGIGVFKQKVGVNFEMKNLNSTTPSYVVLTNDTVNNEIDFTVSSLVAKTDFTNVFSVVQKYDLGIKVKPINVPALDAAYGQFYVDVQDNNKPKFIRPDGTIDDLTTPTQAGGSPPTAVYDTFPATYTLTANLQISSNGLWQRQFAGPNPQNGGDTGLVGVRAPSGGAFTRVFFQYPHSSANTGVLNSAVETLTEHAYWTDFDMTFSMRTISQKKTVQINNYDAASFLWHFNEAQGQNFHHYFLTLKTDGLEVGRVDNATQTDVYNLLFTNSDLHTLGTWYKVRIRSIGHNMIIWINDIEKCDITDDGTLVDFAGAIAAPSSFMSSGLFGLYAYNAEAEYSAMTITDITAGGGGGSGEANTASNVGSAGVGIFDLKDIVDLQFRKLNPLSSKISIVLDSSNKKIDFDIPDATTSAKGAVELATSGEASATVVVVGNDSRLTNARSPTAHATTHKSGGSDPIRLDEFAATIDNSLLNASSSAHGLLRKLTTGTAMFLREDGTWQLPPGGTATETYDALPNTYILTTDDEQSPNGLWRAAYLGTHPGLVYDVTEPGDTGTTLVLAGVERYGIQVNGASSKLAGAKLKTWTVRLKKTGTPTGNVTAVVRNSSDSVVATFVETLVASTLTTSFADVVWTLASPYTLATGDRILMQYSGANGVIIEIFTTDQYDGALVRRTSYNGTTTVYSEASSTDIVGQITVDEDDGRIGVRAPAGGAFPAVVYEYPYSAVHDGTDTSASLLLSDTSYYTDFDVTFNARTTAQKKLVPNAWETFWFLFRYNEANGERFHHYYVALKTVGLELGKKDNVIQDDADQRYLFTDTTPFTLGTWYKVRIRAVGNHITVWINDTQRCDVIDDGTLTDGTGTIPAPSTKMYSGKLGLYCEDAEVESSPLTLIRVSERIMFTHQPVLGFFGATPIVQPTAISSPTADVTSLKTAVDAIRTRLINLGLTA